MASAEVELNSFKRWFAGQSFVGETAIVDEIEAREQYGWGLPAATAGFSAPDLIKPELTLRGLFRTDLVLGNNAARQFALIEFEGAEATSILPAIAYRACYAATVMLRIAGRASEGIGMP